MNVIQRIIFTGSKELSISRIAQAAKKRLFAFPQIVAWKMGVSKHIRENRRNIRYYHNIHRGKRCFVIANGPSLKDIDFDLLKNEYTIGMNRIYLLEKSIGFSPNYLVVADVAIQLAQFTEEYKNFNGPKFYAWAGRKYFPKSSRDILYFIQEAKYGFATDFTKPISNSRSVTNTCLLLAFYMGFSEVILVGKDHSYNISGKPGDNVHATGEEKNHFIDGYYKKGQIWKVPAYKDEELAYSFVKDGYRNSGRIVRDATVGGHLDVFEKVDFKSLFNN